MSPKLLSHQLILAYGAFVIPALDVLLSFAQVLDVLSVNE